MSIIKKILFVSLLLQTTITQAKNTNDYQYVIYYHNIKGDKNFQEILSEPLYYNIKDDLPSYRDTAFQKNRRYERLHTTYIDKDHQIFHGKSEFDVIFQGKTQHITSYSYFLLDKREGFIRGGELAPGFYEANFIGIDQKVHQWPNK